MAKQEYIKANKDWLEAKAKEEGVQSLPKGIYYKVLAQGDASSATPHAAASLQPITQGAPLMVRNLTAAEVVCRWLAVCAT